jgi:hypothetical protein
MQVNHVGRLLLIMQMKLKDFSKKPLKIGEQKIYLDLFIYLINQPLIFLWFVSWQCNLGGLECLEHLIANFQLNGSGLKHEKLTKKNIHNLAINGFRRLTAQFWLISVFLFPVSASLTTYLFGLFVWRIWFISFDSKLWYP